MSKIMIVDDEAVIAFELETTLSALGYEVVGTAGSGSEAVEMATRFKPDLILMDIMMPGDIDGIEAAKRIKAAMDVAVVFLTAFAGDRNVDRAKQVEPSGYLIKPIQNEQVKAAIEIALYTREMAQQLNVHQRLNRLLMDSLPHPAMLVNRNRIVIAANRVAIEAGTVVSDYCWKTFGKCAYLSKEDRQYIHLSPGCQPQPGAKCTFCMADEAMMTGKSTNNPHVAAFERLWDTYWVPVDDEVYLHYAIDVTERIQMEEALRRSKDELGNRVAQRTAELKALSTKLLDVQESERKRIANDLHDSIGQMLAALKVGVENAIHEIQEGQIGANVSALKALVPMTRQACDEARRIHTDLRPPLLDDIGIVSTISWFCRELEALYRGVQINKQIDIDEDQVPENLKIVIFRILQEALNNAVKHAAPSNIEVSFHKIDGYITLSVKDDGQGFDNRHNRPADGLCSGFGLKSMTERTRLSGGSFFINSNPGGGTVLRAVWSVPD